jgi:hypothetical protein
LAGLTFTYSIVFAGKNGLELVAVCAPSVATGRFSNEPDVAGLRAKGIGRARQTKVNP